MNELEPGRPDFPDQELKLFGPGTDSGTFDYFTDAINGEEGASRSDYSASEDDNVIVQGVSGEKGGLGYFGFSYFEENQDTLKAVEVDGGDGCVAPSVETAQDGTYKPLSRPLFVYAKTESFARPEVEAFVSYMLDNATAIAEEAQFVPLTDEQLEQGEERLRRQPAGRRWRRPSSPRARSLGSAPRAGGAGRRGRRQGRPRPLRARLGRDDGRDRHRAARAGDRVLPRGLDRRLPHRERPGRRSSSRRASACSRSIVGTLLVTAFACLVACRSGSARRST